MSISELGPVNSGLPFRTFQKSPLKNTAPAASPLEEKINKALSDQQDAFTAMHVAELKKRVAFYSRFDGKIGNGGIHDAAVQANRILAQMNTSIRTVV